MLQLKLGSQGSKACTADACPGLSRQLLPAPKTAKHVQPARTAAGTHLAQAGGVGLTEAQRCPAARPLLPLALAQVAKGPRHAVSLKAERHQGRHHRAEAGKPAGTVGEVGQARAGQRRRVEDGAHHVADEGRRPAPGRRASGGVGEAVHAQAHQLQHEAAEAVAHEHQRPLSHTRAHQHARQRFAQGVEVEAALVTGAPRQGVVRHGQHARVGELCAQQRAWPAGAVVATANQPGLPPRVAVVCFGLQAVEEDDVELGLLPWRRRVQLIERIFDDRLWVVVAWRGEGGLKLGRPDAIELRALVLPPALRQQKPPSNRSLRPRGQSFTGNGADAKTSGCSVGEG
jgi:hypothetical protein